VRDTSGWIKLYRQIQKSWIWESGKPFDERSAWIDLLLTANHSDNKIFVDGELKTIERGQFVTSVLGLGERWGWQRKKVSKFLNALEMDNMITQKRTTHGTTLTIVNYDFFQDCGTTDGTTKAQQKVQQKHNRRTTEGTTEVQRLPTNKNVKNNKNVNNDKECKEVKKENVLDKSNTKRKVFKPPTVDEVREYLESVGSPVDAEAFVAFYDSNGWMVGQNKMKSWKSAIVTWEKKGHMKRNPPKKKKDTEEEQSRFDVLPREFYEDLVQKGAVDGENLDYSKMSDDDVKVINSYKI
jgi:hypothetical protein